MLVSVVALLVFQIFLGGWTSTNYAALSCGEYFPTCLGQIWPDDMDFKNAYFWGPLGIDYEFGVFGKIKPEVLFKWFTGFGALVVTAAIIAFDFFLLKITRFLKTTFF
jgi:Cytochrome oxidase assembly protein.